MKSLKASIPTIILILFETAVGILLLTNPEEFTRAVLILFGVVLLAIGITSLLRYLREKRENIFDPLSLVTAIVTLIPGVVCTLAFDVIIGLITAIALIYGVILLISGVCKLQNYVLMRKAGLPVSGVSLASGLIAVIIGVVIIVYPKDAAFSVWMAAGIMLLIEAVIDVLSIIQMVRTNRN